MRAPQSEADDSPERLVTALGTSVRRHRLYPPGNPQCTGAVAECFEALARLETGSVDLSIGPDGLLADGRAVPDTVAIRDLAEATFHANLERVVLSPEASADDLARFSRLLARWTRERNCDESFADALIELGVTAIQVRSVERARVIPLAALDRDALGRLDLERRTRPERETGSTSSSHRGWVCTAVDCPATSLDLEDLAFLSRDPRELACLLESMSEAVDGPIDADRALADRVGELMSLYDRLSPERAKRGLRDLGDSILTLEPTVRASLVAERLLPELLDAGRSAPLLRRLPDDELAAGLDRLASRAVGAAGIVEVAILRLALPRSREAGIRRSLGSVAEPIGAAATAGSAARPAEIRLSVGGPAEQSLREYTAHDLAVTDAVRDELERIRSAAWDETDRVRLRCLTGLVFLARNPDRIAEVVALAEPLIGRLVRDTPHAALRWVEEWIGIADALSEARPDVGVAITAMLGRVLAPGVVREAVPALEGKGDMAKLIAAFGPVAGASILEALETEPDRAVRRVLLDYACTVADRIRDGVVARAEDARWTVQRNVARILGFAGAGHESVLGTLVYSPEPRVTREALLALARIGSPEAAECVVEALYGPDRAIALVAEEAIRRFPRDEAQRRVRELLADPAFYRGRPGLARDLLVRFVSRDPLRSTVLEPLQHLRFHVWRPALAGLGWAAWSVRRRGPV